MAFPQIEGHQVFQNNSIVNTHNVTLPTGLVVGATFRWGNISLEISGEDNMGGYYLYGAENYPASYTFLTNGAFQTTLLQSARMYIAGLGAIGGNQQVIIEDAIRAFSQNKLDY
jgi:hypothetical protein